MPDSKFLPAGIRDYLHPEAEQSEHLRRQIIDFFHTWGYKLVIPPMVEFITTLLHESDESLDRDTFKVVDQISGELLGVRADITPQIARIDSLDPFGIKRFCYIGTALNTLPKGLDQIRDPIHVGAELFGVKNQTADLEILLLVYELLTKLEIHGFIIDLTDSRIIKKVISETKFPVSKYPELMDAFSRKSAPDAKIILDKYLDDQQEKKWLQAFLELNGPAKQVVKKAKSLLPLQIISSELAEIEETIKLAEGIIPEELLMCDFAEATGYHYYTGMSFSVYVAGFSSDLLRGGRYQLKSSKYSTPTREAVGFSSDLQTIMKLSRLDKRPLIKEKLEELDLINLKEYLEIRMRRDNGECIVFNH